MQPAHCQRMLMSSRSWKLRADSALRTCLDMFEWQEQHHTSRSANGRSEHIIGFALIELSYGEV
jgi:hypothetical protein